MSGSNGSFSPGQEKGGQGSVHSVDALLKSQAAMGGKILARSATIFTAAAPFYLRDKNRYFIKSSKFHEFMSAALSTFHTICCVLSSTPPEKRGVFPCDF